MLSVICAKCHVCFIIMLSLTTMSAIMLNVIMLNVVMLNVIMLSVVMLNVVAPMKGYFQNEVSKIFIKFLCQDKWSAASYDRFQNVRTTISKLSVVYIGDVFPRFRQRQ
jgi:hypothetical protein